MNAYYKELKDIKEHFKTNSWELSYYAYLNWVKIDQNDLDNQIKFIGDLMDLDLEVKYQYGSLVIKKMRK